MTVIGIILFLIGAVGAGLIWSGFGQHIPLFQAIPMDFRAYLICAAIGAGLYFWGRRPRD